MKTTDRAARLIRNHKNQSEQKRIYKLSITEAQTLFSAQIMEIHILRAAMKLGILMTIIEIEKAVCLDCNGPYEIFYLHDELWLSIANEYDILCIACTEKRLGRPITAADKYTKEL